MLKAKVRGNEIYLSAIDAAESGGDGNNWSAGVKVRSTGSGLVLVLATHSSTPQERLKRVKKPIFVMIPGKDLEASRI